MTTANDIQKAEQIRLNAPDATATRSTATVMISNPLFVQANWTKRISVNGDNKAMMVSKYSLFLAQL